MIRTDEIRDFYGKKIGSIETDTITGVKEARDFYGRKLGSYDPKLNITRDFYGRKVSTGDTLSALIMQEAGK